MHKLICLLVIAALTGGIVGCRWAPGNASSDAITVSAAVSVKDAFNAIAVIYEQRTGKKVNFNYGASGTLERQIENGAPVDLFVSSGPKPMNDLAAKGLIMIDSRKNFARNTLVLIVPAESQTNLSGFEGLSGAEIQKIAVGDAATVPAGQYAKQTLDRLGLSSGLENKLISAKDVRQVLDYVIRGEVDAGIVYATDARIAGDKVRVVAAAPEELHDPIEYPLAVVKDSSKKQAATEFAELILGADGQNILNKYGFAPANR